ncbi:MAG: PDZ domain-containing protein [Deltaproteobacteria bacterium]|nr:MAG: PDZ domain-containing protein [Deltaproteobacteria bacterium]
MAAARRHRGGRAGPLRRARRLGRVAAGRRLLPGGRSPLARGGHHDPRGHYGPEEPEFHKSFEKARKLVDLKASAGIVATDEERVLILDVVPGSPADKAGVPPGTRLAAVNGRKATGDRLRTAVAETARGGKLELLVENAETYSTHVLEYKGGLRYPRLERDGSKPDMLTRILSPRPDASRR